MTLIETLRESCTTTTGTRRHSRAAKADRLIVRHHKEIAEAVRSGYRWLDIFRALQTTLRNTPEWDEGFSAATIHQSYLAFRRFSQICENAEAPSSQTEALEV